MYLPEHIVVQHILVPAYDDLTIDTRRDFGIPPRRFKDAVFKASKDALEHRIGPRCGENAREILFRNTLDDWAVSVEDAPRRVPADVVTAILSYVPLQEKREQQCVSTSDVKMAIDAIVKYRTDAWRYIAYAKPIANRMNGEAHVGIPAEIRAAMLAKFGRVSRVYRAACGPMNFFPYVYVAHKIAAEIGAPIEVVRGILPEMTKSQEKSAMYDARWERVNSFLREGL